jgi:hypothetical protein
VQKKARPVTQLIQQLSAQRPAGQVDGRSAVTLTLTGEAAVSSVSTTLMLPSKARLVEGSARLDGQPATQLEAADGMAILRLGQQTGAWTHTLQFELDAAPADAKLAAMTRFVPPGQQGVNLPKVEAAWNGVAAEARAACDQAGGQTRTRPARAAQPQRRSGRAAQFRRHGTECRAQRRLVDLARGGHQGRRQHVRTGHHGRQRR